ncbi:MAG: ATP-binding protein [Planctomycetota bacterium]|nr:ATP-binding protein [Planctomycetota bacterium]MDA1113790.1 ATP-binding protein [Planctomycetota bacterium]
MRPKRLIDRFPQYQDRFTNDLIADLYRNETSAIVGHLLVIGMVVGFKWSHLPNLVLGIWAAVIVGSVLIRVKNFRRYRGKKTYDGTDFKFHTLSISGCALAWSLGFLLVLPSLDAVDCAFFMMVFAGITASSVVTLSARLKSYAVFSSLLLLPPVVGMYFAPQPDYAIASMGAIFFLFCGVGVKKANEVQVNALIRRYQNSEIMHDLGIAKKELLVEVKRADSANRAKQEFLANISHEIRTPMNGILGMTDLTLESDLNEDQRTCLETARRCGQSLLQLIDELLDFSKIEAGKMDIEHVPYDLKTVMRDTVDLHRLSGRAKAEIVLEHDSGLPKELLGDAIRIRQIVHNLLGNAVKFTAKGTITVSSKMVFSAENQPQLLISVKDQGVGIPEDRLHKIFESFTQADGSTTRDFGGTGLGLTITRSLVELMGGKLQVTSTVGEGSHFFATLPLCDANQKPLHTPCSVVAVGADAEELGRSLPIAGADVFHAKFDTDMWNIARECFRNEKARRFLFLDHASFDADPKLVSAFLRHFRCTAVFTDTPPTPTDNNGVSPFCYLGSSPTTEALEGLVKQAQAHEIAVSSEVKEVSGLRVLVAEDHPTNALIVCRMLESLGHTVNHQPNGKLAVQAFQTEGADLILMDLQMPVMGGHDACRAIRALPDGMEIPILALTAHATSEERQRSRDAGMDDHLTKPFTRDQLSEALHVWGSQVHPSTLES